MNFIYKVVFNKQIGKFVVVSENAKSAGKSSKSKKSIVGAVAGVIAATAITFSTGALAANDVDLPSTAQIAGDGNTVLNNVQVKITGNGNDVRDKGVTTVIGDDNSITGQGAIEADVTRVEGDSNIIQNTQNATVMGDANFMSSAHGTMVVGNQNETNAEISTIIGSENDVLDGSANTVTGSNNSVTGNGNVAVGTSNTLLGDFLTVEGGENDVQGNTTVTQGVFNDVRADNSNVIGDSNYLRDSSYWYGEVSARNVSILGGSNDIQGSEIGVLGSNNFTNNLSGGERNNYTRYRIDSYLLGEDFAGNNVYNSSVVGSENSFGSYSYFVGDRNISFGDYNSIHGLENEIYGGYNSIFGRNNSMGLVTQYYNEINDSSDVVRVSADNNKVVGDDNIVQGSYINILGSGNLTQNVEEYRPMLMAMGDWDSFNLSEYYYSDGVYNSNITGNANIYGSDSNLLGNENRIYGGNNNAVGNYNRNYGTGNFIAGNNNEIGYYYTDWLYDEENDSWGEYTQFQENYNNSILGSSNRITGNYSTIVGEQNTIDADFVNIQGHNNRAQASSYMAEAKAMSGVDLGDMSLNEYYNAPAFSSNVMGAENIYGEQTNILGSRNELYGYANSAVGNENYIFGELNNAFGQNNQIGQIEGGYEYDPERGYYTYRETLKEVFGNNVMGYQNGVNGDDNSIIGNNNMSVGSVSIIQPPQAQFMNEWDDRPTLHKEMTEDGYPEIDSSNSFVVGNWNEYSEMSNIFGGWNSAYGYNNTITGSLNSISGEANFVGGYQNDMWGTDTIIVGNSNSIYDSRNNTVVGSGNSLESVEILVRETPPDYLENIESEFDLNFDQLMDMLRFTVEMEASKNDGVLLSEKNTLVGDNNSIVGLGNSIFGSENSTGWYDESNPNTLMNSIVAGSNNELNGLYLGVLGSQNRVEGAIVNVVGSQNAASGFLLNVIGGVNEVDGVKDGNVIGNMNSLEGEYLYVNGSGNSAYAEKAVINGVQNQVHSNLDAEIPNQIHEITVSGFNNDLRDTHNSNFVGSRNNFEGSNLNVMGNGNSSGGIEGLNQGVQDSNIIGNNNVVAGKANVIGQDNVAIGILPNLAELPEQDPTLLYALDNISNPAATVIGSGNQAAFGSIAIGQDNIAVVGGIAIGNNTVASLGNIAIGANAIADGSSLSNDAYFIDGAAKYELAIANAGEDRRITGVAAGANANDAVNVEQLTAVFDNLDDRLNGVVTYDRDPVTGEILTDKVTLAGENGTTITNVADAVADSDAVNLGQVNTELAVRDQKITTNTQNIEANTRDIAANTAEIADINETGVFFGRDGSGAVDKSTLVLGGEGTLTQVKNVADAADANDAVNLGQVNTELAVRDQKITTNTQNIETNTRAIEVNTTDIATNVQNIATNTRDIATNTAEIANINETAVFFGRDGSGAVDKSTLVLGSEDTLTQVKNVAWASDKTDAINLGQAESLINGLDFGGIVRYDFDAEAQAYVDNKITLTGENGTTITNVADAVADSDAVNLGQVNTELAVRDQKITTNTQNIETNTRAIEVNTTDIATNVQNIATNTRDIATHTAEIANINETAVFFGRDGSGAVDKSMLLLGGENNTLTQIKNVANANDRTDAINLGQVQDMFNGLDFGGIVRYDAIEAGNYNTGKITLANTATNDVVTIGGSEVSVVVSGGTTISNVATAQNADEAVNKGLLDSEIAKVVDQVGNIKGAIQYEISEEGDVNYGASILRGDKAVMRSVNVGGNLVDGTTDQYEGGVNVNVVADGGTKIKNLANATEVDEAVNLGQLNLAIAQINDTYGEATLGAVQYEINNGVVNYAKARLRGEMVAYDTDANGVEIVSEGGTTVANVANATLADHAVNLGVLNSTIKPIDTSVKRNTTDINVINQSGVFFGAVNQDGSLAVDRSSLMLGSVDVDGNVTALTQIKNVAKANTRTDAVNLGQVQDMFDDLPTFESLAGVVKYDRNLDNSLNTNSLTLAGSAAVIETNEDGVDVVVDGGTVIKNVGEATAADHAVNKGLLDSQLALRDEKITTNSQNIAVNTSNIRNLQETGVFFNRVDGLVDTSVLNLAANGTRITNVANAQTRSDAVNLGQVLDLIGEVPEQVNLDGVVRYDKNTDGTNNKDQITLAGQAAQQGKDKNGVDVVTSGGTTISNVANGIKADDAINKGQFDSALEDLKGSTVQYDRNTDGTVNNKKVTLGGAGGTVLTNVANGKIEVGSTDAVNGGQIAELIGSIEIPEQLVTQDAQTKEINVATGKDGKVVNVNGTEGDRVVAGVADGKISKTSNEAVTGKQLNNTNTAMATYLGGGAKWDEAKEEFTAPTYTVSSSKYHDVGGAIAALDARDNALDNKINDLEKNFGEKLDATNRYVRNVEKRVNAGVAASMAMEAAPYVAGKFTYAMGAANHGGEQAIGATFRRTAESGRWSLTTGFAKATEGDASVRIGFSGVID